MQGATAELGDGPAVGRGRRLGIQSLMPSSGMPSRTDLIAAVIAAVGSLLAAAFSLQLWRAHLHVPFLFASDGVISEVVVKDLISGGWAWHIHGLGAPAGTQLFDFPIATDALNLLTIKILGIFSSDPSKVMNVWLLLTFPAEAITSYIVLRWLKVSPATSVVCSILFADAPYHLFRGEAHLLLSSYYDIPIATYMCISILDDRPLFRRRPGQIGVPSWLCRRNLGMLILCMMIGSLGVYYATFTIMLAGVAGLISGVGRRRWQPVLQALAVILLIGGTSFANDLPAAIYRHQHGVDHQVADRLPQESETYALTLAQMVLPIPESRIGPLANLRSRYDTTTPVLSEGSEQSLGLVAAAGLIWMGLVFLAGSLGYTRRSEWFLRQRQLAFLAVIAFLIGTFGGVSALLAYVFSAQLRGWNRISIFIAFFAIATVGLSLDALGRRFARGRRVWLLVGLAAVLLYGIYDQSSRAVIPDYYGNGVTYNTDAVFVHAVQRQIPPGAAVLSLPYVPFPENPPVGNMLDYELARPYVLTTDGLRFSYGAMKGRPADWQSATAGWPDRLLVDGIAAAGFSGIWLDREGYTDDGTAEIAGIESVIGSPPMLNPDGHLAFFDLRPYAARLRSVTPAAQLTALAGATLHPFAATFVNGFYPPNANGSLWATPQATASVSNATGHSRQMVFSADVQTPAAGSWRLRISTPDGEVRTFAIGPQPRAITFTFTDPAGTHTVNFSSTAPVTPVANDPRSLAVLYSDPVLGGAGLAPFLVAGRSARPRPPH
jgi:hypothetical protein